MATRLKEGMIPYTGGIGIEITDNHVINVLLRALNNLIHVNEDRELYVDLQISDGVEPDYDFEVGVTTGRILEEDGWPQNATILNRKTTSGDYVRLIYAADDKLYYDPGTGEWRLLATWEMVENLMADSNCKKFEVTDLDGDEEVGQAMVDWYLDGKYPIIVYNNESYILEAKPQSTRLRFYGIHNTVNNVMYSGFSYTTRKTIYATYDNNGEFQGWLDDEIQVTPTSIDCNIDYDTPYTPLFDGSPATKKYVDDGLALKQDKLIAGANISIAQDGKTISATIPQALVYKGSVNGLADLPSSGQTVGDTYFVEGEDGMYSWDGTQWSYVGGSGIDTTNLFNKTIDTSDDIVQGTTNLFVTSTEKNYWNGKQDALTAGANIQISNNVISATDTKYSAGTAMELAGNTFNNTKPFDPENAGTLSQVLKKTSTGYRWANEANAVTSVNGQTGDVIVDEFDPENTGSTGQVLKKTGTGYRWSNESVQSVNGSTGNISINEFDPQNSGSTGQVLKKTSTGYSWQDESGGGGGGGSSYTAGDGISISNNVISNTKPFDPSEGGTTGQVLTKTANGYNWQTIAGGEGNVKLFTLSSTSDTTTAQAAYDWYNSGKLPIIRMNATISRKDSAGTVHNIEGDFDFYPEPDSTDNGKLKFYTIHNWENCTITQGGSQIGDYTSDVDIMLTLSISGGNVTSISQTTQTNSQRDYLATNVNYTNPYIPQYPGSPATKAYVDSVAGGGSGITNNTTGTTSTINQEWAGTQAEYDALVNSGQIMWGIIYNILPS